MVISIEYYRSAHLGNHFVDDIGIVIATIEFAVSVASDTPSGGLSTDMLFLALDDFFLQSFYYFVQRGIDTSILVRAAIDQRHFHLDLLWWD